MTFLHTIKEKFDNLPSRRKQLVTTGATVIGVGIVFYILVQIGGTSQDDSSDKRAKLGSITLDSNLLEDSLGEGVREEQRAQAGFIKEMGAALKEVSEDLIAIRQELKALSNRRDSHVTLEDLAPKNELAAMRAGPHYPPPVTGDPNTSTNPREVELEPAVRTIKGGIAGVTPPPKTGVQKKTLKSIYLPVGFMDAVLLTGVDAMVGGDAMSNPEPVLARVQAPAVLPNHVRANLQGCFVIGNAIGVLAKERVDVRTVSLSCVDYQERVVIDSAIKGYAVDTDGKKGLSGNVVTRDGAVVGRAFAAGVLEGFGGVVETGAGTQTVSPLGSTQVFNTKEAAIAGIGKGISSASSSLKDYYLDLAKTITPVIEVGTGKKFVLVIQEGINLEIKDVNDVEPS